MVRDGQKVSTGMQFVGCIIGDYSKTAMDDTGRALLLSMVEDAGVAARRDAMFSGAIINETEGRAVLHTALRNLDGDDG